MSDHRGGSIGMTEGILYAVIAVIIVGFFDQNVTDGSITNAIEGMFRAGFLEVAVIALIIINGIVDTVLGLAPGIFVVFLAVLIALTAVKLLKSVGKKGGGGHR